MPLPELRTGGVDVGDTLLKINAMERQDRQDSSNNLYRMMQMKNLESEIGARGTPEEQQAGKVASNALKVMQAKKEAVDNTKAEWGMARDLLARIDVDNLGMGDYVQAKNWVAEKYPDHARFLPDPSAFANEDGTFDQSSIKKFNNWRERTIQTADQAVSGARDFEKVPLYGPNGQSLVAWTKKGEQYDPSQHGEGWSIEKPQYASPKNELYVDRKGNPILIDVNSPNANNTISQGGLKPYNKPKEGEKLSMTDVKAGYAMDVTGIKNRMMIDMKPEEQQQFSGQDTSNILAMLLAGKAGSLSKEKKQAYIKELQGVESYYGNLQNQVIGRKGVAAPKPEKTVEPPTGQTASPDAKIIAKYPGAKKTGRTSTDGKDIWLVNGQEGTF